MAKPAASHQGTARGTRNSIGWAQSLRDMVVTAINKGQLPVLAVLLILLMVIFKMPGEDVAKLASDIVAALIAGELVGYLLALTFGFGWFFHSRSLRKTFSNEYERIGTEKSKLQNQAAKTDFKRGGG